MLTEKQLYKAAIVAGLMASNRGLNKKHIKEIVNDLIADDQKTDLIDDRDNTVALGRILISDERLRQLHLGFTLEHDQAQGLHLLNKTHIRFKKVINKKRTELRAGIGLAIEHEIDEMVKVGALLAAYIDVLLSIRKTLQK